MPKAYPLFVLVFALYSSGIEPRVRTRMSLSIVDIHKALSRFVASSDYICSAACMREQWEHSLTG